MYIMLRFNYYSKEMYVPDGYIKNMDEIYKNFFEWIEDNPGCWVESRGEICLSYNENHFVEYVNETVLVNSKEKAYIVHDKRINRKIHRILDFF